ncbi:MAG: hypothetical protein ACI85K_003187 [Hyphomicrobiaceae bacterium]|jgi:hypothetical protein
MTRLLLLLVLACHLPAQQVALRSEPIVFGEAFELTVTAAADFDAGRLLPLVVELLDRTPTAAGERWRFKARCYQVGEVTLSLDPAHKLTVVTSLPEPAGELEWPSEGWLIQPEQDSSWLLFGLLGVGVIGVFCWSRFLRSAPAPAPSVVTEKAPPWDALAALRDLLPPDSAGYQSYYQQLKAIVRRHCHARFRVPAEMRTSEELVLALTNAQPTLRLCLATCDIALFGGLYGSDQNHQHAKDHAVAFVAATGAAVTPAAVVTPAAAAPIAGASR